MLMNPAIRDPSRIVRLTLIATVLLGAVLSACAGGPDAPAGAVHVLTVKGSVNPVMERYINRGIGAAEDDLAAAIVIRLNTPGGLSSSMDEIVQRILRSRVPVIVYVWPSGGQAASAGTYIAYASHIAAMTPGTVIGSATPIDVSGKNIEGDLGRKVLENAVAKIRALALLHGRNADWAEQAVREGISAEQNQALSLNVINVVAKDVNELLSAVDGQTVEIQGQGDQVLHTGQAPVVYNDRNFMEDLLDVIANPNIAFLLLSLGSLALFIEIVNPGQIFPGVFGVISLLLGFFALSVLPFNWVGVALILFAFVLFGLEMFVTSQGILGIGAAISLVFGGILLTSDNPPEFQVSRWLVFALAGALTLFVLFVVVNIVRIRRMPAKVGVESMVGRKAIARSPLDPQGFVFTSGEYWAAESDDGHIQAGESVIITAINGLKLKVERPKPEGD
jgi:membrane-bound serine protease (ClpP class)